ncbi:MAG: hypothetical protein QM786_11620 [Breznakibacter sp.]
MGNIFVGIYHFLSRRVRTFAVLLILLSLGALYFISRMNFKEDASSIIPRDERINAISDVFNSSEFADRIIVTFSMADSVVADEMRLLDAGQQFFDSVSTDTLLIAEIEYEIDQTQILGVYDFVYNNLPLYMTETDYGRIDSLLSDTAVYRSIEAGYRTLISPAGFATGKFFFKDPLNIASVAMKKLASFNIDENFVMYNGHIFTKDHKNLLLFIDPLHPSSNTRDNAVLVERINQAAQAAMAAYEGVTVESYGGTIVAIENSRQVKQDIALTVSISLVFLTLLFWFYFRQMRIIVYLFIPVALGSNNFPDPVVVYFWADLDDCFRGRGHIALPVYRLFVACVYPYQRVQVHHRNRPKNLLAGHYQQRYHCVGIVVHLCG